MHAKFSNLWNGWNIIFFKYYGISGSTKNEFDSYLVTTTCGKPRNLSLDQVTT